MDEGLSVIALIRDAQGLGAPGALIGLIMLIAFGGVRRWWVFGWLYADLKRERDQWRELALSGTSLAEHSVTVLARRTAGPFHVTREGDPEPA